MMDTKNNIQNSQEIDEVQINMVLKDSSKDMFLFLKQHYNLGYNAEVIRLLIKREYDRCKKEYVIP